MVVAIDFDNTIVDRDYEPLPGVKHAINLLREQGHKIIIHSCNSPKWIERVLNNHDLRFDAIWTDDGKPVASLYIDDRGFRFTDWTEQLPEILKVLNG